MATTVRDSVANQLQAAIHTLGQCIEKCPDDRWQDQVVNLTFDQCAFHTLFFTDYYLQLEPDQFKQQPFHQTNQAFFREYEELIDRPQTLHYSKSDVLLYRDFVHELALSRTDQEDDQSLCLPCPFERLGFSRCELFVYMTRHIQHHAGQLGACLRKKHGIDVSWRKSGWPDHA